MVMTCRDLDGVDFKVCLFPPDHQNHTLVPECADQSAYCVVQSQLIKPLK